MKMKKMVLNAMMTARGTKSMAEHTVRRIALLVLLNILAKKSMISSSQIQEAVTEISDAFGIGNNDYEASVLDGLNLLCDARCCIDVGIIDPPIRYDSSKKCYYLNTDAKGNTCQVVTDDITDDIVSLSEYINENINEIKGLHLTDTFFCPHGVKIPLEDILLALKSKNSSIVTLFPIKRMSWQINTYKKIENDRISLISTNKKTRFTKKV